MEQQALFKLWAFINTGSHPPLWNWPLLLHCVPGYVNQLERDFVKGAGQDCPRRSLRSLLSTNASEIEQFTKCQARETGSNRGGYLRWEACAVIVRRVSQHRTRPRTDSISQLFASLAGESLGVC